MAEIAGLTLGVVGLAGIVGAFKDVVDLYSMFVDSKQLGQDYEILDTKLEIEKTMLLLWADRVGLLRADYDPRLDAPNTRDTVFRVLTCIRSLLSDASQLRTRYGVQTFGTRELTEARGEAIPAPGGPRRAISSVPMELLTQEFGKLNLQRHVPEETSLKNRFRWAVRDKKQFENLLSHLSHFTSKLGDLIPPHSPPSISRDDLGLAQDVQGLKILLQASVDMKNQLIANTAQAAIDHKFQEKVLDALWFRTMTAREEEIGPAHPRTLDWTLQPPEVNDHLGQWDDLPSWLRSGRGIYWVYGKAGSGKSTLMKRLFRYLQTKRLLTEWANGAPCHLIGHFFWFSGTPEQKSQEGLARSLLHQILSRHPYLIQEVLPGMWRELNRTEDHVILPSLTETKHAFRMLSSRSGELGKICVFIDALDEVTGDYQEAITFIKELTVNSGVKAVVSSRPVLECIATSGGQHEPKLELHTLTRYDIRGYICDVIARHEYMRTLTDRHRSEAIELMGEVERKSSGVFLWVVMACRSVLSGLADGDQLAELWRRVQEFPQELGEMFKHMLSKVGDRYREEGAYMLRVIHDIFTQQWTSPFLEGTSVKLQALPLALL
jgi:hypothetical protein